MRQWVVSFVAVAALAGIAVAAAPSERETRKQGAARPVVIELFQSQGCSSCPPALAVLNQEADRPGVIALNFAVTYWDYLGWKDIYAKPEFTKRQWDYARAGRRGNVSTPQLIVGGSQAVIGSRKGEVDAAITAAVRRDGPVIGARGGRIAVGAAPSDRTATVWVVDYDPRSVPVAIRAGENGGRTIPHRNVVRRLTKIGDWAGQLKVYATPPPAAGLARAVLVQSGTGGPIVAARKV